MSGRQNACRDSRQSAGASGLIPNKKELLSRAVLFFSALFYSVNIHAVGVTLCKKVFSYLKESVFDDILNYNESSSFRIKQYVAWLCKDEQDKRRIVMAFFEDLEKKITQTGETVVQKTKDSAEILKLEGMIYDEEKKLDLLYKQLGKQCFDTYLQSHDEKLDYLFNEIQKSIDTAISYSEQVKKLKKIRTCPACGNDVESDSCFCNKCGKRLDDPCRTEADAKLCPKCGTPATEGFSFCMNCGASLQEIPAADPIPEVQPEPVVEAEPEVQPAQAKRCSNCGAEIDDETIFCMNCGMKVGAVPAADPIPEIQPEPVFEAEPEVQPAQAKRCSNCGAEIDDETVFCMNCGMKVEAVSSLQQTPFVPNRCPKCNAEINPNHAFCAVCGSKIGEFEDDDELKTIAISRSKPEPAGFCPNCKCEITENSAFCMNCGTKL